MIDTLAYFFSAKFWYETFYGYPLLYPIGLAIALTIRKLQARPNVSSRFLRLKCLNPWVVGFTLPFVLFLGILVGRSGWAVIWSGLFSHSARSGWGHVFLVEIIRLIAFGYFHLILLAINITEFAIRKTFMLPIVYYQSLLVLHVLWAIFAMAMSA